MNNKILFVLLIATLSSVSFGQGVQNYQCTIGDLQRRVEILYEAGGSVPCEVHYYKDTETTGERQVLWRALNEVGYCERKAQEFIAKLEDMGWSCAPGVAAEPDPEPQSADDSGQDAESQSESESESGDDTDVLMPGEVPTSSEDT